MSSRLDCEGLLPPHDSVPFVTVTQRGALRLKSGHLWVYRSDLSRAGTIPPGALVHVRDDRGRVLGSALYSSASQIAIRLLTSQVIPENELFTLLRQRIDAAIYFRQQNVRDADSYRVIFSEADLLPGMIVDKYNDVLAMQVLTQAFNREDLRKVVAEKLAEHFPGASLLERGDPHIRELEQLPKRESEFAFAFGDRASTVFHLNGVRFHFDGLAGQKTGAFLDQRENYAAAARYAHGDALDCFTYQGGFALHLARVCSTVTAVDASRPALEVAEQNEQLNRDSHTCSEIEWIEGNAFDLLKDHSSAGRQYDTIVLDPPAFAKSKRTATTALRGYKELNLRSLKMLRPGGVLVTCSCSFHVGEPEFLEMLAHAAADAGRRLRILEKRGAATDHPVLVGVPETSYLKCVIVQVID
ncbi:MAG TPA: class I SAM-dependent rRNA methyltransferase [Candidatus Eisenbacteria bacterium]|nr:class I SAM-dependent rRNA methyltransferase [Candidatus Eisenbacteria bacterium]